METLKTPRLILRGWREDDAEDYLALAGDLEVSDYSGCERPANTAAARDFIKQYLIPKECLAITLRDDGCAIGNLALLDTVYSRAFTCLKAREAAFSLLPSKWGRGIMSEALDAILKHSFSAIELDFVCCGCFIDNARCERLLSSFGFLQCFETQSPFVRSDTSRPVERLYILTESAFRKRTA